MSEQDECQYLGRPSDGLFYYKKKATGEIVIVETDDEVGSFVSGDFDGCPPHSIIRMDQDIVVEPLGVRGHTLNLNVVAQVTYYENGQSQERGTLIEPKDLMWLLSTGHIKAERVKLHQGFEQLRQVLCTMLIHSSVLFTEATAYPG